MPLLNIGVKLPNNSLVCLISKDGLVLKIGKLGYLGYC